MSGGRDDRAIARSAAAAGLRVDLPPDEGCEVWPENWIVMQVATRMMFKLDVGFNGVIGFRDEALPMILRGLQVKSADRLRTLDALSVIEGEVVKQLRERK